jgi:hypothetical protein
MLDRVGRSLPPSPPPPPTTLRSLLAPPPPHLHTSTSPHLHARHHTHRTKHPLATVTSVTHVPPHNTRPHMPPHFHRTPPSKPVRTFVHLHTRRHSNPRNSRPSTTSPPTMAGTSSTTIRDIVDASSSLDPVARPGAPAASSNHSRVLFSFVSILSRMELNSLNASFTNSFPFYCCFLHLGRRSTRDLFCTTVFLILEHISHTGESWCLLS